VNVANFQSESLLVMKMFPEKLHAQLDATLLNDVEPLACKLCHLICWPAGAVAE